MENEKAKMLTVGELIDQLSQFDRDLPVLICRDGHFNSLSLPGESCFYTSPKIGKQILPNKVDINTYVNLNLFYDLESHPEYELETIKPISSENSNTYIVIDCEQYMQDIDVTKPGWNFPWVCQTKKA